MISQKHTFIILLVPFVVITFIQTIHAKSVYVINDAETSQLQAYKIEDTNLIWQADYVCPSDPFGVYGAVGIAIHESSYGEFLFVTYEGSKSIIEMVYAKTMISEDNPVTVTGAANLAGIAVNAAKNSLN